jgi:hypothetical protein
VHRLVVGISGCGKSRLIRERIIPAYAARGVAVLVLDPVGQAWPGAAWVTDDPWRFLATAKASRRCVLVVDECDETLRGSAELERGCKYLATRSRNDGHLAYFIAQRAHQIPPSYRNQCSGAFVFKQTAEDAEEIYRITANQAARLAPTLPASGSCIEVRPDGSHAILRVF